FAHHLSPDQLVRFVNESLRVCRKAVFINDLIRDPIHLTLVYCGFPLYRSRLTRNDAPASVRQAYTQDEMRDILSRTNAARGEIVSAESLALLAGLLASSAPALLSGALRIPQARLFFDGHSVHAPIDPPAASIARFDLDFTLWQAAQQAGVSTSVETTIESVT